MKACDLSNKAVILSVSEGSHNPSRAGHAEHKLRDSSTSLGMTF
jgi:hypothetical protein